MSVQRFGDFSLAYAGVLLVSQLVRVALGEASMLWASTSKDAPDVAPVVLGAAIVVTPTVGLVAGWLTLFISRSMSFAIATALGVFLVSLADTTRYALLARGRVRRAVGFDLTWTLSELFGLTVLCWRSIYSPALLMVVWVLSAALAVAGALGVVWPASPRTALWTVRRNPHWWRLSMNEAIITGSSYILLAVLGLAAGTGAVGLVRAALLPYLWVQLSLSAIWLVVLSRRPTAAQLRRFSRLMGEALLAAIVLTALAVRLIPGRVGKRLIGDRWDGLSKFAVYAAIVYAAFTVAELLVLQLKARARSSAVLGARLVGASVTAAATLFIVATPTPRAALAGMIAGHFAVAIVALGQGRRNRSASAM
jgi:hypothetical protein